MTHKTLRELWRTDRAAAIEIIDAIDRGDQVEFMNRCSQKWQSKSNRFNISLSMDTPYRLAPRDPIIDWSQIGAEIVAFHSTDGINWYGSTRDRQVKPIPAGYWPKAFIPGVNLKPGWYHLWTRPKEGK